jgi:ATP phosphoribosyltransferase
MMNLPEKKLKIALPNKGRLRQPAVSLMQKAGYRFRLRDRALYASCTTADIIFVFLRADDIPVLVDSGAVDMGITGQDLVLERGAEIKEVLNLGFGNCRLCVAAHENFKEGDLTPFKNKNIATSFPHITRKFFADKGIDVKCIEMNGSVEIMISLDMADAIVDIVETGDSLKANHLKVIDTIGSYQTVLIARPEILNAPLVQQIKRRLQGILIAQRYSLLEYNISGDRLKEAEQITPGYESPTLSRLEEENWYAVKVMVEKKNMVSVLDRLEKIGATAIIETEIKNCRL